jgi:hypothetical protein
MLISAEARFFLRRDRSRRVVIHKPAAQPERPRHAVETGACRRFLIAFSPSVFEPILTIRGRRADAGITMMSTPSKLRTLGVGVVLGAIAATQGGCLLVAAGAGAGATVAYVRGDTESTVDATPQRVIEASKAVMQDMDVTVVSSSASALDGDLIARTARDAKVHVVAKSVGERATHVSIRIGTFGDKEMSNRILLKLNEKLAAANTPVPPASAETAPPAPPATQPVAGADR